VFVQIRGGWSQTTGTGRLWRPFRREREILGLQGRVGLEANDVATIAQVQERGFARAYGAALQTVLIELHGTEMFAVAAVLPLDFDWSLALTFEVHLTQQMAAIFTLNWTLPRSEKSSFVFRTEYSHFRSSL
jgi:hypothetical protein